MYCPYCGITHDETVVTSVEHVIPYGLGGSDDLTIPTCKQSNETLGSEVDAPFMNFCPVRCARFFLGLKSTNDNAPTMDLSGRGWIGGKEVAISNLISAGESNLKIAVPKIMKTPSDDGREYWQVSGDPAKVREIIEGKLRKQVEIGKTVTREDGTALHVEDLDEFLANNVTVTQNIPVVKEICFDYLVSVRFYSKLALGIGHLHFGERFSRSNLGETLRRHMTVQRLEDVRLPGALWPRTEAVEPVLNAIAKEKHHVIAITDGEPPALLISLFGEYDAFIPLGELPEGQLPTTSIDGAVWRIELPSRKLERLTMDDLIAEHSEKIRLRAMEALHKHPFIVA